MTRGEALKILDTIPTIGEQVDALEMAIKALEQQEQKWERLKMYLADLQLTYLTYSPGLGSKAYGDQHLYNFVTFLINELQRWEEGEQE